MKALVLFSGGVDSTTALALAIQEHGKDNVVALSISYGQKHTKEIEAANKIAQFYQVEHLYLDLAKIFTYSNCSLLQHSDNEIPHESYNEQLNKQMAILFLLMCLLEMVYFYLALLALPFLNAVILFIMVLIVMMQLEAHILIVVKFLIMR